VRRCEGCGAFLCNEPNMILDLGTSFGEDGPEHDGLEEIRVCVNGHENVERVAA